MNELLVPQAPSLTTRIGIGGRERLAPSRGVEGKRVLLVMLAIVGFAAVPAIVVPALWTRANRPSLGDFGSVPEFALTDERGQPFTEAALSGHPTIISFIFTRCDSICPITTTQMRRVQDQTYDVGASLKLVSLSVDPSHDTPERLANYAQRYQADPRRWKFVTGRPEVVRALVEGPFMTSMQREADRPNGVPNIAHGGSFILLDSTLHIRGIYDSGDPQRLNQLMRDARHLARTARPSRP